MVFKKTIKKNDPPKPRRVFSDIKPGPRKIAPMPDKKILSRAILDEEDISFLKSDQNKPIIIKDRKSNGARFLIAAIILASTATVIYFYWTASLTLAVERKRTTFDLGAGVKITLPAKAFSMTLAKRGEGESKDSKKFSQKATGAIIVYNNYSTEQQVLVAGTRFTSPTGLVYRARDRVVVPSKQTDRPGAVEIIVVADQPGDKYNTDPTDFKIPGFQGTPKYDKFYARGKGPIQGGAIGEGKVVGKQEADELLVSLEPLMQAELKNNFESSIPDSFLTFPSQFQYTTVLRLTDPPVGSPGEKFFGEVRGEAKTFGVDRDTYSNTLANALFKDSYEEGAVKLEDNSALTFRDINVNGQASTVTMLVSGRAVFEWLLNMDKLKNEVLAAKNNEELRGIFARYPAISKVEANFKPSFLKRIPKDSKRVIINVD